jgi:hypothetical protein
MYTNWYICLVMTSQLCGFTRRLHILDFHSGFPKFTTEKKNVSNFYRTHTLTHISYTRTPQHSSQTIYSTAAKNPSEAQEHMDQPTRASITADNEDAMQNDQPPTQK